MSADAAAAHEARIRARARTLPVGFKEELARADAADAATQAVVAGLVVLRTVDRWVAAGCASGVDVAGPRETVGKIPGSESTRAILAEILDAIEGNPNEAAELVTDRLLLYAKALELDAKWHLAIAVYDAVVSNAGAASSPAAVAKAKVRRGYCLRTIGRFEESRASYTEGRRIARRGGDLRTELFADLGLARTDAAEGRPRKADAVLQRVARRAAVASLRDVESMALHERSTIAGNAGVFLQAARLGYAAFQLCDSPSERDRILNDIGETFRRLGLRDIARDAFLILSCTARDQYSRWMSLILLLRLAGDDGQVKVFRQYLRTLRSVPLPPLLQIELELQVGYALRALDQPAASDAAFRRAASLARTHGFTRELRLVEAALAGESDCAPHALPQTPPDIRSLGRALRSMRDSAEVG